MHSYVYNSIIRKTLNSTFYLYMCFLFFFFFQAEDGIRDLTVTGVQTCALPISSHCACMCVAFCVVEGGDLRVKALKNWAADVLPEAYRELFLFAALDLDSLDRKSVV